MGKSRRASLASASLQRGQPSLPSSPSGDDSGGDATYGVVVRPAVLAWRGLGGVPGRHRGRRPGAGHGPGACGTAYGSVQTACSIPSLPKPAHRRTWPSSTSKGTTASYARRSPCTATLTTSAPLARSALRPHPRSSILIRELLKSLGWLHYCLAAWN
jgi:hypothetical protein